MTRVNLGDIEDQYRLLALGTYPAVVTSVNVVPGDQNSDVNPGGNHQWKIEFSVEPPDGKGVVKVNKTVSWYGKGKIFAWRYAQAILGERIALEDGSFDDEEDAIRCHGRHVMVTISHWDRKDGTLGNDVANVLPIGRNGAAATDGEAIASTTGGKAKKLNF